MYSYLNIWRQRVQINNKFSSSKEVIARRIPQVSIDPPLLFNLFINDIFLFICFSRLSTCADDNNLFTTGTDIQLIKQMLLDGFRKRINLFYENFMILNPGKCHSCLLTRRLMTQIFFIMITLPSKIALKRKY